MLISRRKRKRMRTRGKRRWKTRETTRGNKRWKRRRGREMGWEGSRRNTRQYGERFVPSQHRDGHKRATYHLMTK